MQPPTRRVGIYVGPCFVAMQCWFRVQVIIIHKFKVFYNHKYAMLCCALRLGFIVCCKKVQDLEILAHPCL